MNLHLLLKDPNTGQNHKIIACDSIRVAYQSTLNNEYELLVFGYNGTNSGIIRFEDLVKSISKLFTIDIEMYIDDMLFKTLQCGLTRYDISDVTNPHSGQVELTEQISFTVFK